MVTSREGWGKMQVRERGLEAQTTGYKINKVQWCNIPYGKYSQYFIILYEV